MIGPDLAQVSSALLGIISAIQMLFWTLTTPKEVDYDLPTKLAGWAVVFRITISRRLVWISILYLLLTIFCLLEEIFPLSPRGELYYDLSLLASFSVITAYLVKLMVDVHRLFVRRLFRRLSIF